MALDEAILEAVQDGKVPPTLRFYAWEPPCLSIGYAQSIDDVDRTALDAQGWDLVRRPTGGKAILHTDEVTYSLAAPVDHAVFSDGVLPSYERISRALTAGLQNVGLEPELHASGEPPDPDRNPVCFQNPSAFEITVGGQKLVGSAQVRRASGILQHGSIPLRGEIGRICLALRYESEAARERAMEGVAQDATTIERALGEAPTWEEMARELTAGFERTFGLDLELAEPEPSEISRASAINEERYSHPDWIMRS